MRFSLKTMLVVFAVVAAACAGGLYPTRIWAALFFTCGLLLILTGAVAALVRGDAVRAYWIGFTVFAGGYFAVAMFGDVQPNVTREGRIASWDEPRLLTSQFLLWADDRLTQFRPDRAAQISSGSAYMRAGYSPMSFAARGPTGQTLVMGHTLLTLLLGLVGGGMAKWLYSREKSVKTGDG